MDTIKIYVGQSPNGLDAESLLVLDYSLKKNTTGPYEIIHMRQNNEQGSPWNNWATQQWATPFSGYRWAVPWVEQEADQAIYCDSDFIFIGDVRELWDEPFQPGKVVQAKGGGQSWRYCSCKWKIPDAREHLIPLERMKEIPEAHSRMMHLFGSSPNLVQEFNGNWNCIDGEGKQFATEEEWKQFAKAIHYSDMSSQLHHKYAFPRLEAENKKTVNGVEANHWFDGGLYEHPNKTLVALFDQYYQEALDSGMKVEDYCVPETDWVAITKASQAGYGTSYKAHQYSGG